MRRTFFVRGFTSTELLFVFAIMIIFVFVVFVALDPVQRFQEARDARRSSDVVELLHAVKLNQVDHEGAYMGAIESLVDADVYMIGTATTGCASRNTSCETAVSSTTACVDLSALVTQGYMESIPVSSNGAGMWSASFTGYTITRNANAGTVTIRACESENTTEIKATR